MTVYASEALKPGATLELNLEIPCATPNPSDVFRDFLAAKSCFGKANYMNTLQLSSSTPLHSCVFIRDEKRDAFGTL